MTKVITYGTFDLLHNGHLRLLERAKKLGDYLIVGVTSEEYDKFRGKINVNQSLIERIEAVKATGLADEIIIEWYEGQKIDDIKRFGIDIFTVGSDWQGKFDYLQEFCQVVYLPRTKGISSSQIRTTSNSLKLGIVGSSTTIAKFITESSYVNGVRVAGVCTTNLMNLPDQLKNLDCVTTDYATLVRKVDAVYLASGPADHYQQIKYALSHQKHVLCELPLTLDVKQNQELLALASAKGVVLDFAIKTAYTTAYNRLIFMLKSGIIGKIVHIDATCTTAALTDFGATQPINQDWNNLCAWGTKAMLPIFQLLGTNYREKKIITWLADRQQHYDAYTKINFLYRNAEATLKVGHGVKAAGQLMIVGTEGYVYVPEPWWETEYFEVHYANANTKKFFYGLDGEGIRYEILSFVKAIKNKTANTYLDLGTVNAITKVCGDFDAGLDTVELTVK